MMVLAFCVGRAFLYNDKYRFVEKVDMASFDKAIELVLRNEGGYVDHPSDPGGKTKWGVTLRFLQDYPDYDVDGDGTITGTDIKKMTMEDAKRIYKDLWWDKYGYGRIEDQVIATKVFDFSINMGVKQAHKLLQRALNRAFHMSLVEDGVLGPITISVINNIDDDVEGKFVDVFSGVAWEFYQSLIAKRPSLSVFAKGWKHRAHAVTAATLGK